MKWLTRKQVSEAAKTPKGAKECSRLHWHQLATATLGEINRKIRQLSDDDDLVYTLYCALCLCYRCVQCPLKEQSVCCCQAWESACDAFNSYLYDKTQANLDIFQKKAKILENKIGETC